ALQQLRAVLDRPAEGGEGVLRRLGGGAAMSDDRGTLRGGRAGLLGHGSPGLRGGRAVRHGSRERGDGLSGAGSGRRSVGARTARGGAPTAAGGSTPLDPQHGVEHTGAQNSDTNALGRPRPGRAPTGPRAREGESDERRRTTPRPGG